MVTLLAVAMAVGNLQRDFFCGNRKEVLMSDRDKERAAPTELRPGQP